MKQRNFILLLLLASMWGPSFLFIKVAVEHYPPLTLVAIRLGVAAISLFAFLKLSGGSLPRGWNLWGKFIFVSFFANSLPFALFSFGEQFADSGSAAILNGTTPIFTILFAHYMISEERLSARAAVGVVIGFIGVLTIFVRELFDLVSGSPLADPKAMLGMAAFVGASICYGLAIAFGRKYLRGLPPLVGPASQLIAASVTTIPIALMIERPFNLTPTPAATISLLVLGIWGTAFAYLVFYKLVDSASATFLSLVTYLLPPIGLILGVLVLGEQPGWNAYTGTLLIVFGVMIVNGTLRLPQKPRRALGKI
jgi:drug/metabolite transporter (DMT)-like permease